MPQKDPTKHHDFFTRNRASQASKNASTEQEKEASVSPATANESPAKMADLSSVLAELQLLRTEFGSKLDSIDVRLGMMANSVVALEINMSQVTSKVTANTARLDGAEGRIETAEGHVAEIQSDLTAALKRIDYLESKTEDMENRSRRKNLRLFGLKEGSEGTRPLLDFMNEKLPTWLGLRTDAGAPARSIILERVHRTLAPPKPNQHRAVIIRFHKFQDREFVYQSSKQAAMVHDGSKLFFAQDLSAETMRRRREFDEIRGDFATAGTYRGFQFNPCRMRVLHKGRIHLLKTPTEAKEFFAKNIWKNATSSEETGHAGPV